MTETLIVLLGGRANRPKCVLFLLPVPIKVNIDHGGQFRPAWVCMPHNKAKIFINSNLYFHRIFSDFSLYYVQNKCGSRPKYFEKVQMFLDIVQ